MAVVGDLALMCNQIITKRPSLDLKKSVFGAQIWSKKAYFDAQKLKKGQSRVGLKAGMQLEVLERSSDFKSLEGNLGLDLVTERNLREKGFLGLRKTKLVCTIGPACCSFEELEKLAQGGMNVARLNMCHNTRDWHKDVIRKIKKLNEKGYCVSLMIDTEGNQINVVDHGAPSSVKAEVILIYLIYFLFKKYVKDF